MSKLAFDIEVILKQHITGGGEAVEHMARSVAEHVLELVSRDVTEGMEASALVHDLAEENASLRAQVTKLKADRQAFKEASFPARMASRGMGAARVTTPEQTFAEYRNPADLANPIREWLPDNPHPLVFDVPDLVFGSPPVRLFSGARTRVRIFAKLADPTKGPIGPASDLVCVELPANCFIDPAWPRDEDHVTGKYSPLERVSPLTATAVPRPRPEIDSVITTEEAWSNGHRAALLSMLYKTMSDLGYDLGREDPVILAARLAAERTEAIRVLREACEEWGDNDWTDELHLGDVIEKHLVRPLEDNAEDDHLESMADAARREDD